MHTILKKVMHASQIDIYGEFNKKPPLMMEMKNNSVEPEYL